FFQAEDGIRDDLVTGVQTCALPIYMGLLWHIPISDEERAFKQEHGSNALLDRMDKVKLPWLFDESNRPSLVAEDKPRGKKPPGKIGRASCRERDKSRLYRVRVRNEQ